jgi:hypothetical protein
MISFFDEDTEDGAPRYSAKGFCALLIQIRYRQEVFRRNPGNIVIFYSHPLVPAREIEEWLVSHPVPPHFIIRKDIRSCELIQSRMPVLGLEADEMRGIFSLPTPFISAEEKQRCNEDELAALQNVVHENLLAFYLFSTEGGCFNRSADRNNDYLLNWLPAYSALITNATAEQARVEKDGGVGNLLAIASLKRVDEFVAKNYVRQALRVTKYSHRLRLFEAQPKNELMVKHALALQHTRSTVKLDPVPAVYRSRRRLYAAVPNPSQPKDDPRLHIWDYAFPFPPGLGPTLITKGWNGHAFDGVNDNMVRTGVHVFRLHTITIDEF